MGLLELLLPPACVGCRRGGALLCAACLASFRPPSAVSDRFVAADAGVVFGSRLAVGIAAFAYREALRRALAQLKYEGAARVAPRLADAACPALRRLLTIAGRATLVPVPIHLERRRARGYNQAALLTERLGAECGLEVADILVRARLTAKQHRLDRAARLRNLRGAISVARGERPPAVTIVVDDIITTSATLDACAAALTEAGAQTVYGFALAREV